MGKITEITEQLEYLLGKGVRFVSPKTLTGRRLLTTQGSNLMTGNEHLLAVKEDKLICTIEKVSGGWAARFGLQELSDVYPTLEACQAAIVKRAKAVK